MALTIEQALAALDDPQYQTIDGLKTLVGQVSADVPGKVGATTLLYSGNIGAGPAWVLATETAAASPSAFITIEETPVARFIQDPRFRSALEDAAGTSGL